MIGRRALIRCERLGAGLLALIVTGGLYHIADRVIAGLIETGAL
ncbi:hypothetical protein [Novosphingobium sp. UBA1939]|nr:hypothetical protein [Novosphingobium sp. UBA1939]